MLKKVTKKSIVSNVMIIIVMVFNGQFIGFFFLHTEVVVFPEW